MTNSNEARVLVTEVLQRLLDENDQLGGMAEYGKGWNDKAVSMNIKIKEVMKQWQPNKE